MLTIYIYQLRKIRSLGLQKVVREYTMFLSTINHSRSSVRVFLENHNASIRLRAVYMYIYIYIHQRKVWWHISNNYVWIISVGRHSPILPFLCLGHPRSYSSCPFPLPMPEWPARQIRTVLLLTYTLFAIACARGREKWEERVSSH